MIDVCLLGTGGTMPVPERRLTALYARAGGLGVLIDCGEGTQLALRESGISLHDIDVICITHFHADHVLGLPGLLLTMAQYARAEKVTILGPKGISYVVSALCVCAPKMPFPVEFAEIDGEEASLKYDNVIISAFALKHSVECFGYGISLLRAGVFLPEKARANGVPVKMWNALQHGQSMGGFTPDDVLGAPRRGLKLIYATDTRPTDTLLEAARDADLAILEGMYDTDEKRDSAIKKGHMLFSEAADLAREANVSEMWLTHFSPSLKEPEANMESILEIFPRTVLGADGMKTTLKYKE